MKNLLYLLGLLLMPCLFFSQKTKEKDSINIQIKRYTRSISEMVNIEKKQMKEEIKGVDQEVINKKISANDAIIKKKEIATRYEKRINDKIEHQKNSLDKIIRVKVNESIYDLSIEGFDSISLKNIDTVINKKLNYVYHLIKDKNTFNRSGFTLTYGFQNLVGKNSYNPFAENPQLRFGNTHSFELKHTTMKQINGKLSPWLIEYGLAYRSDTYMPKRPLVAQQINNQLLLKNFELGNIKRSKLRNVYLLIPVDFHILLNPTYKTIKGKQQIDAKNKNNFFIGLGAYAGIRTRSIAKVKYYTKESGDFEKYQNVIDSGVDNFLFGVKLSLHYRFLNLYIKKDLTPIFNNSSNMMEKNGIQVGLDVFNVHF